MSYDRDEPPTFEGIRRFDATGNMISNEGFKGEDGVDNYLDPHDPKVPKFEDGVWKIVVSGRSRRWSTPLFPLGSARARTYLRHQ